MKKTVTVITLILVAVVGLYLFFFSPEEEVPVEVNFSETGNLILGGPERDRWTLIYEEPGAPALSTLLFFDDESICIKEDVSVSCGDVNFTEGDRVSVEGNLLDGTVTVSEIDFEPEEADGMRQVNLFYYNPEKDKDEEGNIMCGRDGLVPVEVTLPAGNIIEETVKLLIRGVVPEDAIAEGVTTEYPLEGFALEGSSLNDGILTLAFNDPNNKTVGGSCRVGILWFQIEETAKQFPEVKEVRFLPEDIFQP